MDERLDRAEQLLGDHGRRLDRIESELVRSRRRLHELETDRSTIRHLAQVAQELAVRANRALDHVDQVAESAVEAFFKRRHEDRREEWKYRLGWVAATVIAATFLVDHLHVF